MKSKADIKLEEFEVLLPFFDDLIARLEKDNKDQMITELIRAYNGEGRELIDASWHIWYLRATYLREFAKKFEAELTGEEVKLLFKIADASEAYVKS